MSPPTVRKRKFHRRSKNGCQTCRGRHVRCDERQPLCTNCLQSGSECIYPLEDPTPQCESTVPSLALAALDAYPTPVTSLHKTPDGQLIMAFDELPKASRQLLQRLSHFAVLGQRPVSREVQSSGIQRALEKPAYMHICLMLSACQWAWVTGSMDQTRLTFLYHKSATYQFVRSQLESSEATASAETLLAISALALTEGTVGDLDASAKHLKGFKLAMRRWRTGYSLPQRMLQLSRQGLKIRQSGHLVHTPDYQPTFMALLFSSVWDIGSLPPTEAPKYGWWEESDTDAARTWQNHTKHLNLDYEISRGFDPSQLMPRILNSDARSSRTCFIATFFYLYSEMGDGKLDAALLGLLLEQLFEDVDQDAASINADLSSLPLWLWCTLFGAAIANHGQANNAIEEKEIRHWQHMYYTKLILASQILGVRDWFLVKLVLAKFIQDIDDEVDEGLQRLWDEAIGSGCCDM